MTQLETLILNNPENETYWIQYIDKLKKNDPVRAQIIELGRKEKELASLDFMKLHQEFIPQVTDLRWLAQFYSFRGYIKNLEKEEIVIRLSGKAPSRYGGNCYRVERRSFILLMNKGWEIKGKGRNYFYMIPPKGSDYKGNTLPITIYRPTIDELRKFDRFFDIKTIVPSEHHKFFGSWIIRYESGGYHDVKLSTEVLFTITKEGLTLGGDKEDEIDETIRHYAKKKLIMECSNFWQSIEWDEDGTETTRSSVEGV